MAAPWQIKIVNDHCFQTLFYGRVVVLAAVVLMLAAAPGYSFFQSTLTQMLEKEVCVLVPCGIRLICCSLATGY
jgi:LPS O-antigen subunit length determinant protein (WzzB/FepE family)